MLEKPERKALSSVTGKTPPHPWHGAFPLALVKLRIVLDLALRPCFSLWRFFIPKLGLCFHFKCLTLTKREFPKNILDLLGVDDSIVYSPLEWIFIMVYIIKKLVTE